MFPTCDDLRRVNANLKLHARFSSSEGSRKCAKISKRNFYHRKCCGTRRILSEITIKMCQERKYETKRDKTNGKGDVVCNVGIWNKNCYSIYNKIIFKSVIIFFTFGRLFEVI